MPEKELNVVCDKDVPCSAGSRVRPNSDYRRWIQTNDRMHS